jgi:hypothetical protein
MHKLKSRSNIFRFRFAAFLLCVKCVMLPITFGVLIHALFSNNDNNAAMTGVLLVLLTALVAALQWIAAARTGCPLCMAPVLARKACRTHRNARTALGSHRLRVALAILFKNSFQCPYCHEPTALAVRERNPTPPP